MLAPIILFTYNRLDHTRKTVEALLKNELASQSDLYIFSDQAKSKDQETEVSRVRDFITHINGFKSITNILHPKNKGLATSIIQGVTEVLKKHDKVIVLEDDLETSPYFLNYMNEALTHYSPDNIWSIAGYTPNIKIPNNYNHSTYLAHRNCSWGWATWKQNWEKSDWVVSDFNAFFTDKNKRQEFERGGNDLSIMLLKQQQQLIHSWSIRFNYAAYKNNLPTVYPVKSFINNLGVDGSGTNMKKSGKYASKMQSNKNNLSYCPDTLFDEHIGSNFKCFYNTSLYRKLINWYKIHKVV